VHPITDQSPFWDVDHQVLINDDAELLIQLRATDDTFFQQVHARSSYHAKEFVWGAKFRTMYINNQDGVVELDLEKLSEFDLVQLPEKQKIE
jgi:inward rectifier potassium channel